MSKVSKHEKNNSHYDNFLGKENDYQNAFDVHLQESLLGRHWELVSGHLVHVNVGPHGVYGCNKEQNIYFRNGNKYGIKFLYWL